MTTARLWVATRNDVRLQWRHGFYAAYALVTVLYVVALRFTPAGASPLVVPILVFSDPAVFGFFFTGALVILERDDGMMQTLFVTPLGVGEYVGAKVISLATIAVATSLAIAAGAVGQAFDAALLAVGVALTAAFIVQVGLALASRFSTINRFMLAGSATTAILVAPLLVFVGVAEWRWVAVLPTHASLALIGGAFAALFVAPPWQWLAGVLPQFWVVKLTMASSAGGLEFATLTAVAAVVHTALLWALARAYDRRVE